MDRDVRTLASIVDVDRPDVPAEGLPPSLLADLASQIRCDVIAFAHFDAAHQHTGPAQLVEDGAESVTVTSVPVNWKHYWHCQLCSHPDRTGDLRSVVTVADFYSGRLWRSLGTRCGINRPMGFEHALMLTLPMPSGPPTAADGTLRLFFLREHGLDFTESDRATLTLLRPHVHAAFLDAESRRHPVPRLTPRQEEVLRLVAAGHTNATIAHRLDISDGTVRVHLEHIYTRLGVLSRIAAINRVFPPTAVLGASVGGVSATTRRTARRTDHDVERSRELASR
jgi:DNA-binding CsgD family transcriptional regulator